MNESAKKAPLIANRIETWTAPSAGNEVKPAIDPLDFGVIYERWFEDVSRWIRTMGAPEAECEDLVQDVFIVVHRRLPSFSGHNIAGWLFQIARRRLRNFRRLRWVKYVLFGGVPLSENLTVDGVSPAGSLETSEKRTLLERLLGKLNDSEREALMLFEVDGYSGAQIAQMQGVSTNTVWARIHMARKKLNALLAKHESRERRAAKW